MSRKLTDAACRPCTPCSYNKTVKKIVGKGGQRWYKNVGLGFRTPKEAIEGELQAHRCTRGLRLQGRDACTAPGACSSAGDVLPLLAVGRRQASSGE